MMALFGFSTIDIGVLGLYLLFLIGIGVYFQRGQKSAPEFFLASRSMGWLPVGLSLMATVLSALSYTGFPSEGYRFGLLTLAMPFSVWLIFPLVHLYIMPLYRGLSLTSIYEYLELRFDRSTRSISSYTFIFWRLFWLGGVLYAPCKALTIAAGLDVPVWILIVILGIVSTIYTFLGGMRAVIWTDVIQGIIMFAGVVVILLSVMSNLDGGGQRLWDVARELERTSVARFDFDLSDKWSLWAMTTHFGLAMLSFYVADQITAQRFLTAVSVRSARQSFFLNCLCVSLMIPALSFVGLGMLAYYHDNPEELRLKWVLNVSPSTQEPLLYKDRSEWSEVDENGEEYTPEISEDVANSDKVLVDTSQEPLTPENLRRLIAERRILKPNSRQPFLALDELTQPGTDKVDVLRVMTRKPPKGKLKRGEAVLHKGVADEIMPAYISDQLSYGVAGLILAALLAASMSSLDSGLNSISSLLVSDVYRSSPGLKAKVAERLGKTPAELKGADELYVGRFLVIGIGIAATIFSLFVAQLGSIFDIILGVVNTFGGPLTCIILLGIFNRRTGAKAAKLTLAIGMVLAIALMFYCQQNEGIDKVWALPITVVVTLVCGFVLSMVFPTKKSRSELRGLVVGNGKLGSREEEEEAMIEIPDFSGKKRWK